MNKKLRLPKYFEPLSGVLAFILALLIVHFIWKLSISGDESDKVVEFVGIDISAPFNLMVDHVTVMVQHILGVFGFHPSLEPYNIFRYDNGNAVRIVWSCTGIKQSFIFTAIILLFNGSWKQKLWFIPAGLIVLYIYNLLRIAFLSGLVKDYKYLFDFMHEEITKYIYYAIVFGLWVLWEEKFKFGSNLNMKVKKMLRTQLLNWPLARENYKALDNVEVRKISFVGFEIYLQFNPARALSTNAKIDKKSIEQRPCFLCAQNRPKEQIGVKFGNYTILVNPYPIFKEHYTIASNLHTEQKILPYVIDMMNIARSMHHYLIFYNGPKCGASAPDHMHFQAVPPSDLPLVKDYFYLRDEKAELLQTDGDTVLYLFKDYIRNVYCIEGLNIFEIKKFFKKLYLFLKADGDEEPMMNVYCHYKANVYYLWIIPRSNFRPWQFFEEGEDKITVSPAAVEMSGILITPVKEHFDKIDRMDVISILEQGGKQ